MWPHKPMRSLSAFSHCGRKEIVRMEEIVLAMSEQSQSDQRRSTWPEQRGRRKQLCFESYTWRRERGERTRTTSLKLKIHLLFLLCLYASLSKPIHLHPLWVSFDNTDAPLRSLDLWWPHRPPSDSSSLSRPPPTLLGLFQPRLSSFSVVSPPPAFRTVLWSSRLSSDASLSSQTSYTPLELLPASSSLCRSSLSLVVLSRYLMVEVHTWLKHAYILCNFHLALS